ncbi:hypothetical protein N1851_023198 [Merluccius polli]|uniref:BED-type domain-containing protein n=1 Tax=Merluccius polli TaxID=89951 RepID=A0AA47MGH6_MERPO|nr:hypothetical protein N1851_023198 [Merluccius polli]
MFGDILDSKGKEKKHSELDKEYALCKLCVAPIRYSGNTTNLRTHIARHHPDILAQPEPPKPSDPKQTTLDIAKVLPSTSTRARGITEAMRYLNEERESLHVCAALDPRFKTLPFLSEDERQATYVRVITEAARCQEPFQRVARNEDTEEAAIVNEEEDAVLMVPDEVLDRGQREQ